MISVGRPQDSVPLGITALVWEVYVTTCFSTSAGLKRVNQKSQPWRMATVSLGLLCVVLLITVISLSVHCECSTHMYLHVYVCVCLGMCVQERVSQIKIVGVCSLFYHR